MATKKAVRKTKKGGKLRGAKKMKEVKPLINSFSFGASN
jgi:hypothetical protein